MTTTNDRINAICKKRQTEDMIARQKEDRQRTRFADLCAQAEELAPRIKDLVDVANTLLENKYTLGKKVGIWSKHEFETDKIDHNLGFVRTTKGVIGVGKLGGGCSYASIWITPNGELGMDNDGWHELSSRITQLESIIKGLDEFEMLFYTYTDSL